MTMARPGASKVLSALGTISYSFFSSGACPRTRSGTSRATSAVSSHRFTASPSVDEFHEGQVTSPEVNVKTVDDAYDDVRIAVDRIEDHYIDPFRVKIIGPDHRIAKAILELYRQYPKRPPSRLNVGSFGGLPVADLYVYPPINGAP